MFYGSICDFRKSRQLFNLAVGQGFIEGRQIGWMDFDLFRRPQLTLDPAKYGLTADRYDVLELAPGKSDFVGGGRKAVHADGSPETQRRESRRDRAGPLNGVAALE